MTDRPSGPPDDGGHRGGRTARLRERGAGAARYARGLPDRVPLVGRAVHQLVRVNLLDCATRLAAQAFLSALPALFVVAVFTPVSFRDHVLRALRSELGIRGAAEQSVDQLLANGTGEAGFGVLGALFTLLSATALSRAIQRVCERCWELSRAATRLAAWRWLVWLLVWLAALVFQVALWDGFGAGRWLGLPLTFLASTALWWWTQYLLLGGRVRWPPLLPGALLCGVAVVGLRVAGHVYLPRAMAHSVARFGTYGVVFTGLSWLIASFTAYTLALALGRVLAEEEPLARRLGPGTG
ncbi:YhjD/YihY/BrkB family envelope integrity protein [Kitasatospora sp. NPDC057904]|uniref:YhjD/YihY/BrkB family envelope integrity protein n=1 Tax=Kitasatospora sp. NPDC057904 TaxID=3346275 RepID=UPI0036DF591B